MLTNPLACPRSDTRTFEVTLYNQEVRALVKQNKKHRHYSENWADVNRRYVEARDAAEARALAARRYPPENGFVIANVATT